MPDLLLAGDTQKNTSVLDKSLFWLSSFVVTGHAASLVLD